MHTEKYKESPLGLIPQDWEVRRLGEIGNVVSGLTYSPNDITTDNNGVLVLRSSNIQNRQLIFQDNVYVSVVRYNRVIAKDILICVRNGSRNLIGKNALITKEIEGVAFGAFMSIFRSGYNDYLIHVFDTDLFNKNVHRNLGATINSINGSDLKEFKFAIPPLAEQERIAEVLGCWDMAIEKHTALIDTLTRRKRALMQQLLTARKRLPNFSTPWQSVKLGDILIEYKEKPANDSCLEIFTSSKSGLLKQSDYYGDNRITQRDNADFNIIPYGWITFRSRSDDGLFSFNKNNLCDGLISSYYPVFSSNNGDTDFVLLYLNFFKEKLTKLSVGTSQLVLSFSALCKAKFNFPSIEEQKAIAQILTTADQEIESAKTKLEALRTQKRGLMQQLLTGKKRLKV